MKSKRSGAIAVLWLWSLLAVWDVQADPVTTSAAFLRARAQLLKDGWRPVNVHAGEAYEYSGLETDLIRAGILEVDSCAMDKAVCLFHYRRASTCLQLQTSGESLSTMTVERWEFRCAEPEKR